MHCQLCSVVREIAHTKYGLFSMMHKFVDVQVREHVEEVMAIVELDKIRGSIVGYPGQSGLSVEQRKRLSIGAHKPRVSALG